MLTRRVNTTGEPVVSISLHFGNRSKKYPAIIDTGFNGMLSVPESIAVDGHWYCFGTEDYELATGDIVRQRIYIGTVTFDGVVSKVYAVTSHADDILIGTKLLRRKTVTIDFRNGKVRIR